MVLHRSSRTTASHLAAALLRRMSLVLVVLGAGIVVSAASASQIVSTSSVSGLVLGVNGSGQAMVSYTSHGKVVHVLAYGAENAQTPVRGTIPAALTLAYDGGYAKNYVQSPIAQAALANLRNLQAQMATATAAKDNPLRYSLKPRIAAAFALVGRLRAAATSYYKTFTCPAYDGPALAWRVAACKAPDGSYWAIQEWPRKLPDYGLAPTPTEAGMEVHLSHWTGALPVLTIHTNWSYRPRYDHLFGTFTYDSSGVYGFASTSSGAPLDNWGRNLYVDTFDSSYGTCWFRDNSFLTHKVGGSFCYGFYPHGAHLAGTGTKYRATIIGPGLMPDIMWQGNAPGAYNATTQATADQAIVALDDPLCKQV